MVLICNEYNVCSRPYARIFIMLRIGVPSINKTFFVCFLQFGIIDLINPSLKWLLVFIYFLFSLKTFSKHSNTIYSMCYKAQHRLFLLVPLHWVATFLYAMFFVTFYVAYIMSLKWTPKCLSANIGGCNYFLSGGPLVCLMYLTIKCTIKLCSWFREVNYNIFVAVLLLVLLRLYVVNNYFKI